LLLCRQDVDELVEAAVEEAPAALQVLDQALRLVLGGDADAADAGVNAIRQREIDDAELAAKGTAGLERQSVSCIRRLPRPPASTMPKVLRAISLFLTTLPPRGRSLARVRCRSVREPIAW
jgi:hypothetical protein